MTAAQICICIAILAYLVLMLVIGWVCSRKNKTADDFYLGGRKLGPLVTAMSAEASDMSSWLLMGLPGLALMCGLPEASWTAIGLAIGTYLNWLLVAKRIRIYSHKLNTVTLPDFFSKRFGDKSRILTLISALFIVIFFIPYTASGFAACGKLFSSLFGIDYLTAMILSAAVIVLYCTMGGFLAASTTDFVQSIVMTAALIIVIAFGAVTMNGFDAVFENVKGLSGYLDLFRGFDVAAGVATEYGAMKVISTLAWGLGYFGMPHILLRFMAIEDPKKLKTSRRVASVWVVISMGIAVLIGVVGYSLMKTGVVPAYSGASAAETIIVDIAKAISSHGVLPALVAGVILAGILASTMSTADSQLLASASAVSQNLIQDTFKVKLSNKASMWLARIAVIVISVIAIFLALNPNSSVFRIVSFAWAGFGAVFGPVVLAALFWKNCNRFGALAGMITGGVTVFVWHYLGVSVGGIFTLYELLPAFLLALVVLVVVSLATGKPSEEIRAEFEEVRSLKN